MGDLDTAFAWLNQFERSHLSPLTAQLIELMNSSVGEKRYEDGQQTLEGLVEIGHTLLDEMEVAEVLAACGAAAHKMGKPEQSVELLEKAISYYGLHQHQAAAARWMLGLALSSMAEPARKSQALVAFQGSMQTFQKLSESRPASKEKAEWYRARLEEMEAFLRARLKPASPASPLAPEAGEPPAAAGPAVVQPGSPPVPGTPPIPLGLPAGHVRLFSVYENLPTAGAGRKAIKPDGFLEVEQFSVDGKAYRLVVLGSNDVIDLAGTGAPGGYCLVKAQDDRMDQAGIAPGDLVLVRLQDSAEKGEIVIVEIPAVGAEAFFQVYSTKGGKAVFSPHSSNPAHARHKPDKKNQRYRIRGVALAVFKPVD